MYFRLTADSAELVDPHDMTSLFVVCPPEVDLSAAVRRADLGELLPSGEHLMVSVTVIRQFAGGEINPDWDSNFEKMLTYAVAKGWTSEDSRAVRAHVERR